MKIKKIPKCHNLSIYWNPLRWLVKAFTLVFSSVSLFFLFSVFSVLLFSVSLLSNRLIIENDQTNRPILDLNNLTTDWLFILSFQIVACLEFCVSCYFLVFYLIFSNCLYLIEILITNYLVYLSYLTFRLTSFPTNLIFVGGAIVLLYIVRLILKDLIILRKTINIQLS